MKRLIVKIGCYWCILSIFCVVYGIESMTVVTTLLFAISLGIVNTLIRPILLIIAIIPNMFTFGLISILVNWLTLWLASIVVSYWWNVGGLSMLLLATVIMLVDDQIARLRYKMIKN